MIEISNMKQPEAISYLRFILKFENKLAFVECKTMQELEKHKIIEIWREKNFLEKFAWDIVEKLNKDVNLQSIAEIFVQPQIEL